MLRLALAAVLLSFAALPASAQEAQCFQNDHYLVIAQERVGEVGTDFIVRPPARGKIACRFETQDGDVRIGEFDDPLYYVGLAGPYLVLSRSTGPDGNVVIYDLDSGAFEPVVDVRADDDVLIDQDRVVFWERTVEGTADNCAEFAQYSANDFGAVIAEERIFDAVTGDVTSTGATHCSQTQ